MKAEEKSGIFAPAGCRFAGVVFQYLFFLLTAWLITSFLGQGTLGDFMLAVTILNLSGFAATVGLKYGVVRYTAVFRARGDLAAVRRTVAAASGISAGAGALLGLGLLMAARPLAGRFFHSPALEPALRVLFPAIPVLGVLTVLLGGVQGLKLIRAKVALENIAQPLLGLILVGLVLVSGRGLAPAVAAWCLSLPGAALGAGIVLRRRLKGAPPGPGGAKIAEIVAYSAPLMAVGLLYYLFTRMDIIMLGHFRSSDEVGVYGLAARLAILIPLPLEALNVILEPTVAEAGHSARLVLQELYRRHTPWVLAAGTGLFGALFFASPVLFRLFPGDFAAGWLILFILGLGQMLNLGVGSAGVFLSMTGHSRVESYNAAAMVALNFVLNLLLIPRYGGAGAAAATAAALGGINLLRLLEVKCILGILPFSRSYRRALVASLAAVAVFFVFRRAFPGLPSQGAALVALAFFAPAWLLLAGSLFLDAPAAAGLNTKIRRFIARIRPPLDRENR